MAEGVRDFRQLVCWKLSNALKCEIFDWLQTSPASRDFTFRDQIRDSSASAPSNIAEGFGRFRPRECANYLGYARASLMETMNHLVDARDSHYMDEPLYSRLMNLSRAALRLTTNLMRQKQEQADREKHNPRTK
jgi:four helix bundle protein